MNPELIEAKKTGKAEFLAELARTREAGPIPPAHQAALLRLIAGGEMVADPRVLTAILGQMPKTMAEAVTMLSVPLVPHKRARQVLAVVEKATGTRIEDPEAWLARLEEGARISLFSRALRAGRPTGAPKAMGQRSARTKAVIAEMRAGRNVVMLSYHGLRLSQLAPLKRAIGECGVVLARVANHSAQKTEAGIINVDPFAPDFILQFAKLCKAMKVAPQKLVTLLPDGVQGGSFHEIEIAGVPLRVALGAATLAYYGKAQLVISHPRLIGDQFITDYVLGPRIEPEMPKDQVETLVTQFYRDTFVDLMRGDPASLNLTGFYWKSLLLET